MCVQFRVAGLPGCRVAGWVPGGCRVVPGWGAGLPGPGLRRTVARCSSSTLASLEPGADMGAEPRAALR